MRLAIVSRNTPRANYVRKQMKLFGFTYDPQKPEAIISFGGDGTLLRSERQYPGVPKLVVRDSKICNKCNQYLLEQALFLLQQRQYSIQKLPKLKVTVGKESLLAVNDVAIRNASVGEAARFSVTINNKNVGDFIGDGLLISTAFGSTGYYHSITRQSFSKGIGIAFNNTVKAHQPLHFSRATTKVKITRGPVEVSADNHVYPQELEEGAIITVKPSNVYARLIIPS